MGSDTVAVLIRMYTTVKYRITVESISSECNKNKNYSYH